MFCYLIEELNWLVCVFDGIIVNFCLVYFGENFDGVRFIMLGWKKKLNEFYCNILVI